LAYTVEAVAPSIVRVEARRRLPATGVVWSADGLIVTAHHVVEQDEEIGVGLADGRTVAASLVGRDPTSDVALLRAQASGLTTAAWVTAAPRVGEVALALGRPGQNVSAALGVVSAVKPDWRTPTGALFDYFIQTDARMYPGFSGGPAVSAGGAFLGINTSAMLRDVTLTIPAGTLRRVAETLLTHGRVRRGYLGVGAQSVRLPAALAGALGQETGLLLGSVEPGSPAEHGGLFMGDTLVAVAGQRVRHLDDLLVALSGDRVGQTVPVRLLRGGQMHEVQITVGEHP
jgi:S1-C subfamily serine protease